MDQKEIDLIATAMHRTARLEAMIELLAGYLKVDKADFRILVDKATQFADERIKQEFPENTALRFSKFNGITSVKNLSK